MQANPPPEMDADMLENHVHGSCLAVRRAYWMAPEYPGRQHGGIITQSCLTKVILLGQSLVFVGGCGRSMSDRTSTGLTREYLSVRSTMAHEYRTRGTEVTRECMSA